MKSLVTPSSHQVFRTIESRQDRLVELVRELIKCFPVYASDGLNQAQQILGDHLVSLGFDVIRQEINHEELMRSPLYVDVTAFGDGYENYNFVGRTNLVARRRFTDDGPQIILNGHLDVEAVTAPDLWHHREGWRSATVVGDRIYGRGASDTLGGVATFVNALECLEPFFSVASGSLELQFVIDEEIGGNGTLWALTERSETADLAIVAEPSNYGVCDASMSFNQFAVECYGRPVHMAYAVEFDNANRTACEVMRCLEDLNQRLRISGGRQTVTRHVMYGYMMGGIDSAIPAATAEVRVTLILPPDLDPKQVQGELSEEILIKVGEHCQRPPKVKPFGISFPGSRHAISGLAETFVEQGRVLGVDLQTAIFPSPCDARLFESYGIPAVIFGPGCLSRAHGPNEFVLISELMDHCKTISGALLTMWQRRSV